MNMPHLMKVMFLILFWVKQVHFLKISMLLHGIVEHKFKV